MKSKKERKINNTAVKNIQIGARARNQEGDGSGKSRSAMPRGDRSDDQDQHEIEIIERLRGLEIGEIKISEEIRRRQR